MSEFSNTLSQFIHEKNIKVYSLIKYCNFDRSTMYKIINGKRNPPSKETLDKMAEFMHLTPAEYSRFVEAYEITKAGADNYYRRKNAQNFLMNFPDSFSIHPENHASYTTVDKAFSEFSSCAALSTQLELNYVIHCILSEEARAAKGKIALFLQPDYEFLFNLLASLNLDCSLEIRQILCLSNVETLTKDHELYTLKYFRNIFPLYLRNLDYQAYYFYDSIHSHFFNLNAFPYFIVTSKYAVACSSDYQQGIFYSEPSVVKQFWRLFHSCQGKCQSLFQVFHLTPQNAPMLSNIGLNETESYLLQPEACLTPFISNDILETALSRNIPNRQQLIKMLREFFRANTRNLSHMHVYFTEKGIRRFIETGKLKEIPTDFYRPFLPEERLQMLQALLPICYQGYYRMLKQPLDQLPVNLHLCVNDNMGYFSFDNVENQTTYLMLNETGLLSVFLDYMQSLNDSNFYTPEETGNFIKSIIQNLQQHLPFYEEEFILPPPPIKTALSKNLIFHLIDRNTASYYPVFDSWMIIKSL